MKHRKIYSVFLLIPVFLLLSSCREKKTCTYPFSHHVFFWLNNPDNPADRALFEKGIEDLLKIPEIKAVQFGVPAATADREVVDGSYTYSYLIFFDNQKGHDIYQDHLLHHEFVNNYSHLWEKVLVYDAVTK